MKKEQMALRHFNRVACVVLGHGGCDCRALPMLNASYCTVSAATAEKKQIAQVPKVTNYRKQLIQFHSSVPGNASSTGNNSPKSEEVKRPLTGTEKLKKLWKEYGIIAVSTYLGIYATTLGSIFFALDFDLFNSASVGLDPLYAIEKFSDLVETFTGNTTFPQYIKDHPTVGTFAIAYIMTKFTEPIRLGLTIVSVPTIARWLGRRKEKIEHDREEKEKSDKTH